MISMPAFDSEHIQNTIVHPLSVYEKKHDASSLKEIHDSIRIDIKKIARIDGIMNKVKLNT